MRTQKNFLLLSLFFFTLMYARMENYNFIRRAFMSIQYSEISGLVSNGCKRVFEDSQGLLWAFTFKGLRFEFDEKDTTIHPKPTL